LISINKNDEKWFDQFASPLPSLYKRQHCPINRFILKLPTEFRLFAYFEREKMNFNSLLTVFSSYWWSSNNPAAKPIKTQQNRTTRRPMRSPPIGADFKRREQPMYNDELQEVVQQNDGDFFSQQQQTYNSIYSPAMSSSPAPIVHEQPPVIITSPDDCCSRTTTKMKKLESRLNSMENEVSALRQRLFKEETELDELQRSCSDHFNNQEQLDRHSSTVSAFSYPSFTVPFTPECEQVIR
jgi:hypothetical protein